MNDYLLNNFPSTGKYWIGYNDIANEDQFVWNDGSSSSFTNWGGSGPSNSGGNEDCTEYIQWEGGQLSGKWNDKPCNTGRWAYYQFPMSKYQDVCAQYTSSTCEPGPGNSFPGTCGSTPTPPTPTPPTPTPPTPTPPTPTPPTPTPPTNGCNQGCGNCNQVRGGPGCSCVSLLSLPAPCLLTAPGAPVIFSTNLVLYQSTCQQLVCEGDSFCCNNEWDELCVDDANFFCDC